MKIYTRRGDKGETALFGGKRVPKDSLRIEAFGTVDELNSVIGICRSLKPAGEFDKILEQIQHDLFGLGADLASAGTSAKKKEDRVRSSDVDRLERHIDKIEGKLRPLRNFILPGGSAPASMIHFARTVCRRAERLLVRLARTEKGGELPVIYLNRLSDLLFVMARRENARTKNPEIKWKS
ncbi:MAG: cob(I)yrinic acid a,c-diamide adenosyltransferase [Ignavibacteria bacterium]|nr:MAG: cob(I)yrinic acid a,c-diamide adenosyltransferase [Ignavibacteria bacterium]